MGAYRMNATDEKSRLPIPDDCRRCANCETTNDLGVERNRCKPGYPMHHECGYFKARTPSVMDGVKG